MRVVYKFNIPEDLDSKVDHILINYEVHDVISNAEDWRFTNMLKRLDIPNEIPTLVVVNNGELETVWKL
jgi:hypothetical protein